MRKNTRNLVSASVLLMTLLAMAPGCTKTGSSITTSPVTYLSLINEATYAPPVSVLLNDTTATVSGGIAAASYSSKYGTIRPGTYDVKFKVASSDSLLSEIPTAAYDTLNFYTLIVYNTPGGGSVNAVRIWDDFSTISSTQANYRFFNLSPDYPNVDLYLNTTQLQSNRTTGDNATNTFLSNFQPVADGVYNLTVKVAGTDSVITSVSQVGLSAGNAYTLFLSGNKNSTNYPLKLNVLQAAY